MRRTYSINKRIRNLSLSMLVGVAAFSPLSAQKDESPGKLRFAMILTRHGVRSPTGTADQLNQYSAQPWPKWDVPPGHLTAHGAQLMVIFGGYYRAYFAHEGLVDATGCGDAARVAFYSDSDQRTVETGKSLAAGMFPGCPEKEQPEQHALAEGQPDELFHSLASKVSERDHDRAVASIAGRIGGNLDGITEAYHPQLEALQRVLLACPSTGACPQSGHTAPRLLLNVPASLDSGKGDHLAELKGPLNLASTITENFLLEYADGMPMNEVGWGRVDLSSLKQFLDLHTAASDLTRRTQYLATAQASNALAHILKTMEQAATGKAIPGALGSPEDRAVVMVGHDTNLSNIAGMLNINWLVDGRRDDTPPGGALVFEIWQKADASDYEVRAYYTAQSLEQMRNLSPLSLSQPPQKSSVFIPGCSTGGPGFPCAWKAFQQTVAATVDPRFVR